MGSDCISSWSLHIILLCQVALTVCVLARLCWASIGTGDGGWGGNDVASGLNAYNLQTTLIQYDSIYTKIWARSWKIPCSPSSVITEHCACASRITRPDSPMRHIDTDRFLHDMAHISHITFKCFNMISNGNVQSFRTYWNEPIIQHYSTASWTTFHIFDGLSC